MLSNEQIKACIRSNKGGSVEEISPPSQVDNTIIWEVWTHQEDEYHTRYIVLENATQPPIYYADFQSICVYLSGKQAQVINQVQNLQMNVVKGNSRNELITLWVAALVFVMSTVALLWLLVTREVGITSNVVAACLGGLIASGGWRFFGKWIQP